MCRVLNPLTHLAVNIRNYKLKFWSIFSYPAWSQTQMSSVYSKIKRIGFSFPILSDGAVFNKSSDVISKYLFYGFPPPCTFLSFSLLFPALPLCGLYIISLSSAVHSTLMSGTCSSCWFCKYSTLYRWWVNGPGLSVSTVAGAVAAAAPKTLIELEPDIAQSDFLITEAWWGSEGMAEGLDRVVMIEHKHSCVESHVCALL